MPLSTPRRSRSTITLAAVGAVLLLSACAPEPVPEQSPSAAPETPSPEPYAGPAVFVGDELDDFLPTADEITTLLPGATGVTAATNVLEQISDGGGPEPVPSICATFFIEQSLRSVGSRNVGWEHENPVETSYGHLWALQFADESQAQERMDQLIAASEQCATFEYDGQATFDDATAETTGDVRTLTGTLRLPESAQGQQTFHAYAAVGNVLVQLSHTVDADTQPDAAAVAQVLSGRAQGAHDTLIETLTAEPPTPEEDPTVDASAPWSEWPITASGIGPILLGDPVDTAVAAADAPQVTEPEYESGPWLLSNAEGTATLRVQPVEGGSTVASITAGADRSLDEATQDGAALPARGEARVGMPLSEVIAAFPAGTIVDVVSSGDHWYDVATRDGRLFRFHANAAATDAGATVVGITVEDATTRPIPQFS